MASYFGTVVTHMLKKVQQTIVYLCFCTHNYVSCDLNCSENLRRLILTTCGKLLWHICYTHVKEKCNKQLSICASVHIITCHFTSTLQIKYLNFPILTTCDRLFWYTCYTHVKEKCNKQLSICDSIHIITCHVTSTVQTKY